MNINPLIGVGADYHCGSRYGIWPKGFEIDGRPIGLNKGQLYLLAKHEDAVSKLPHMRALIFNGDLVDGKQKRGEGRGLITTDLYEQSRAFYQLTEELRGKADKIYVTAGSYYHNNPELEEALAETIGAIPDSTGHCCREVLDLEIEGIVITAYHELVGGAWVYPETALARAKNFAMRHREETGVDADILVGSHRHRYMYLDSMRTVILTPCWEVQTGYAKRRHPSAWTPHIGMIVLELDPQAKAAGLPCCQVHKLLYPAPKREITKA